MGWKSFIRIPALAISISFTPSVYSGPTDCLPGYQWVSDNDGAGSCLSYKKGQTITGQHRLFDPSVGRHGCSGTQCASSTGSTVPANEAPAGTMTEGEENENNEEPTAVSTQYAEYTQNTNYDPPEETPSTPPPAPPPPPAPQSCSRQTLTYSGTPRSDHALSNAYNYDSNSVGLGPGAYVYYFNAKHSTTPSQNLEVYLRCNNNNYVKATDGVNINGTLNGLPWTLNAPNATSRYSPFGANDVSAAASLQYQNSGGTVFNVNATFEITCCTP